MSYNKYQILAVNRELQKLKAIIEERRLQEDIKQLGEAATRRGIISLSVDRRRKESLYVVLLWLGITGQIRKCPPLPGFDLPGLCYRFHGETETYAPTLGSYAYHVSYTLAFWKQGPEGVRFNIRCFFSHDNSA